MHWLHCYFTGQQIGIIISFSEETVKPPKNNTKITENQVNLESESSSGLIQKYYRIDVFLRLLSW